MNIQSGTLLVSAICSLLIMQACGQKKSDAKSVSSPDVSPSSIEVIAHRGDSYAKPENTMAAFNSAWQKNADAVELDVYLTADHKVMALHDETTGRTGDKDLSVTESTSEKLRTVDVGSFKGEQFAGEKIPFLKEVIATVPEDKDKQLVIEIKDSARIVPYIKKIIDQSGKKDQMVIISFKLDVVKASKKQMPEVPAYWLRSAPRGAAGGYQPIEPALLDTVRKYHLDGLNVNYHGVTPELVKASHDAGYKLLVWTVNEKEAIENMVRMGVDGITTDRIERVQNVLESASK